MPDLQRNQGSSVKNKSDNHRKAATKTRSHVKDVAGSDLAVRKASDKILRESSERYSEAMKRLAKR
jgi:hypothetical protein